MWCNFIQFLVNMHIGQTISDGEGALKTECQPIGVRDVIKYLVGVLEHPAAAGQSYDIGGPDVLTYEEMLRVIACTNNGGKTATLSNGRFIEAGMMLMVQ